MTEVGMRIIVVALSIGEMYLGYRFLTVCWVNDEEITRAGKVLMNVLAVVMGILAGINREIALFSSNLFVLQVILTGIPLLLLFPKKKLMALSLLIIWFTLIALVDFLAVFVVMEVKVNFFENVFFGMNGYKVGIFLFTRCVMMGMFLEMQMRAGQLKEIFATYKKGTVLFCVGLVVLLRRYQIAMAGFDDVGTTLHTKGIALSLFLMVVVAGIFVWMWAKITYVKQEMIFIRSRDKLREENYRNLRGLLEENQQLQHDMKHHFQILRDYAREGRLEDLRTYLDDIQEPLVRLQKIPWTRSEILNLILNQKFWEAEQAGIEMNLYVDSDFQMLLKEAEISALFGNLLDNALEACLRMEKGKRWVCVTLERKQGMIFIRIENSIDRLPRMEGSEFLTGKEDKKLHGLGVKSVKRIVEKYEGEIEMQVKIDSFITDITFFNEEERQNEIK
ncbi:ATP-binding protein [Roseburia hominis]